MNNNSPTSPLVAVVTPVYNGADYLAKAMRSVQSQDYPNLIHVILNNASTDATAAIIDAFRGGRVDLLSSNNEVVAPLRESWNKAFSLIPKEAIYAKLLCADDLMHPSHITRCVKLAEADSQIELILSDDVYRDMVRRANLPDGPNVLPGVDVARRILDRSVVWLPYQHFFVRIHEEDRGSIFCGKALLPDPYVVIRSALRGKFGYLREPLVYTRSHPGSQTSKMVRAKDATMLVAHLRLVKEFGKLCWDEADYNRVVDLNVGRLARFVMRWAMAGQLDAAKVMSDQLAKEGFQLTLGDYARYALGWPAYALNKYTMRTVVGPRIDECAFEGNICDIVAAKSASPVAKHSECKS
jgi:glycosyltransferase involved in cell wall biosynthesis